MEIEKLVICLAGVRKGIAEGKGSEYEPSEPECQIASVNTVANLRGGSCWVCVTLMGAAGGAATTKAVTKRCAVREYFHNHGSAADEKRGTRHGSLCRLLCQAPPVAKNDGEERA